jgi:hypothetical protein
MSMDSGDRVQVDHPEGVYHGKIGTVIRRGRYGCRVVKFEGIDHTPEISVNRLILVEGGETTGRRNKKVETKQ